MLLCEDEDRFVRGVWDSSAVAKFTLVAESLSFLSNAHVGVIRHHGLSAFALAAIQPSLVSLANACQCVRAKLAELLETAKLVPLHSMISGDAVLLFEIQESLSPGSI